LTVYSNEGIGEIDLIGLIDLIDLIGLIDLIETPGAQRRQIPASNF